jgi:hypothetical protein
MTALAKPARPEQGDDALRPVPWQRMAGITWRQHRFALAGVAGLLGALAVWLWIIGTSLHQAYAAAVACPGQLGCLQGRQAFIRNIRAVPRSARVQDVDQLPAGQPVLALPVDRGGLAARTVRAAHRRNHLAGPPLRRLTPVGASGPPDRPGASLW